MRPTRDDNEFYQQASNIVEALVNLNYLACEYADYPVKVLSFANLSGERLNAMTQLLKTNFSGGLYGRSKPQ
jgi:hypothetical protein